ncbi:2108_t:CDS:1, partial [Paraglomus brasilianum]
MSSTNTPIALAIATPAPSSSASSPPSSTPPTSSSSALLQRRKSVRFSRFEKVYYTHSPVDYDRSSILTTLKE